ncbi:cytochrome P460 family protein [Acidicapsa ligni]|uniref:cytochrome P460 family protein n=1 Tax=Acidicapsa ligni TaxID=542300 RepID=UPI0021E0ACB2|nr:cytochrome P460 family protein [Acidicapsa ligni]
MPNSRAGILTFGGLALGCLFAWGVFCFSSNPSSVSAAVNEISPPAYSLVYDKDGDLAPPMQYRQWVYLTSGLDMSYTPKADSSMSMFDNVFVNPEAWNSFQTTGTWPDKTVLVLEVRGAQSKGSINKSGHFQSGDLMGMEIHVKDESRFPGKWAFFDVASPTKATLIPEKASCYTCHKDHAAVDTTFVQFYPTLLPIAQKKATLSAPYRKEVSPETPNKADAK